MGVCDWFKRRNRDKKKKENMPLKFEVSIDSNGAKVSDHHSVTSKQEFAATQIQTAFRAYKARKMLSYLKRISRFQEQMTAKQNPTALKRLHFWNKIQAEISGRRLCQVAEGRMKQMKLQDRVKVQSKFHELEMKWWSGPSVKEQNGLKVQQIEKATSKRERALAYAFSHQWRPNSNRCFGQAYRDLSKESWGWNWIEPRIVVYRLEGRVVIRPVVSPWARIRDKRRVGALINMSKRADFR